MELSHFYSFQKLPGMFWPNLFAELAENGARSISLIHPWMERLVEDPGFLKSLADVASAAGLRFNDAHAPFSEGWHLNLPERLRRPTYDADMERIFAVCEEAGVLVVTWHVGTAHEGCTDGECRDACRKTLDRLVGLARQYHVRAAIENTLHETDGAAEILRYLALYSPEELGCCFDSGHANVTRIPETEIDALVSRLYTTHLHDNDGTGDQHRIPGEGTIDWPALMRKLATAPYAITHQNEVNACSYHYPIRRVCRVFDELFAQCDAKGASPGSPTPN